MIKKKKRSIYVTIVKSAHVLMRADARKGVASLRKMTFSTHGAGIAHGNVPRTTTKAKKERKARTGTAILFLRIKRAADDMSRRVISIKKRRANAILKKAYLYRGKI